MNVQDAFTASSESAALLYALFFKGLIMRGMLHRNLQLLESAQAQTYTDKPIWSKDNGFSTKH
jgi:hypothetical protein